MISFCLGAFIFVICVLNFIIIIVIVKINDVEEFSCHFVHNKLIF